MPPFRCIAGATKPAASTRCAPWPSRPRRSRSSPRRWCPSSARTACRESVPFLAWPLALFGMSRRPRSSSGCSSRPSGARQGRRADRRLGAGEVGAGLIQRMLRNPGRRSCQSRCSTTTRPSATCRFTESACAAGSPTSPTWLATRRCHQGGRRRQRRRLERCPRDRRRRGRRRARLPGHPAAEGRRARPCRSGCRRCARSTSRT